METAIGLFALFIIVVSLSLGAILVITPMERLVARAAWTRLPMPRRGSAAYSALTIFWKAIGVGWLVGALAIIYEVFIHAR
jgi:hypothetical protein